MTKKTKKQKDQTPLQQANDFIQSANAFEKSRIQSVKRFSKISWAITFVSLLVTVLSLFAVAMMSPLKTVEPFVIRVDNNTGATDIVTTIKDTEASYGEVIDKYWLSQYVRHRESYDWYTVQANYDATMLFSNQAEQTAYASFIDSEAAPHKVFRNNFRVNIRIYSISWVGNVAQVRFEKEIIPLNNQTERPAPTRYLATVSYGYLNAPQSDRDRLINPLGLQVTHYRVDSES